MKDRETSVNVLGIAWKVTYHVHGKYYPATLEQPEEYPEVEILDIKPWDDQQAKEYATMLEEGDIDPDHTESTEFYEAILEAVQCQDIY